MYFSDHFGIDSSTEHDWFDPQLEIDTPLFVDPFLIYNEVDGIWAGSDDALADHFARGFEMLAGHRNSPHSLQYKKTVKMMLFPEPREFGLGVASQSTEGSGGGNGLARKIVAAMSIAIERGLEDLRRFEELGVLVDRIGRDRISDITCNILKSRFISYTESVALAIGIPTTHFSVVNGAYDPQRKRWTTRDALLPLNPVTNGAVLLTPKRFLRELPTLNSGDWWNFVEPELRDDLNLDIGSRLPKERIVSLARAHPELVRKWSNARSTQESVPYDVDRDPEGIHNPSRKAQGVIEKLRIPDDSLAQSDLPTFINAVSDQFRHYVEEEGGWSLLYNEDSLQPKRELSIQLLYKAVVLQACESKGVFLDREVDYGRGPVDFVFTSGQDRVLLEIKKIRNGKFWNGLEDQLPSYLKSAKCTAGWFLAVRFADTPTEVRRTKELPKRVADFRRSSNFLINYTLVDARPKLSASKLDGVSDGTYAAGDDGEDGLD